VVGYFTQWGIYERQYYVDMVPASRLTHINYAFINITKGDNQPSNYVYIQGEIPNSRTPTPECFLADPWADVEHGRGGFSAAETVRGNFGQLRQLKERHPHLRTLMSIGGWTWSTNFPKAASTADNRRIFAASCVAMMRRYGFDGLDVDWEYPVSGGLTPSNDPADKRNYTLLLQEMRRQLDAAGAADGGRRYLLTIAAPAGDRNIGNLELRELGEVLDWINVMNYDLAGEWDSVTGHLSAMHPWSGQLNPLWNGEKVVDQYLAGGVPEDKIVLGVPFYGRSMAGVTSTANLGLAQPFPTRPGPGSWAPEPGLIDWKHIDSTYQREGSGYQYGFDDQAKVPWLFNPSTGVFITYDHPQSIEYKARYARQRGLGGVMFWELTQDDAAGRMLNAVNRGLTP
jgi:chitinase